MKKTVLTILTLMLVLSSAARVFADNYSDWAIEEYRSANTSGLISESLITGRPSDNISRQEFCELVMNMYIIMTDSMPSLSKTPFGDTDSNAVKMAYSLGVIDGKTKTEFYPDDPVKRQEIAKIIMRTINAANKTAEITAQDIDRLWRFSDFGELDFWATNDMARSVKHKVISGFSEDLLMPKGYATREQAIAIVNRAFNKFSDNKTKYDCPELQGIYDGMTATGKLSFSFGKVKDATEYIVLVKDAQGSVIKTVTAKNTYVDMSGLSKGKGYTFIVGAKISDYITVYSDPCYVYYEEDTPNVLTSIDDRYNRVFPDGIPFLTEEEASANMALIDVPVWRMNKNGDKVSDKAPLMVNKNLADEVMRIFTNIYNDPEQFPIKNVGAYSWRETAFGSVSQHSYGTCIDINFDENYYCYPDGTAITGSFWKPYENPFSITPDGSVVKNFLKYGWYWGKNWTTIKDHMHFSYLGK